MKSLVPRLILAPVLVTGDGATARAYYHAIGPGMSSCGSWTADRRTRVTPMYMNEAWVLGVSASARNSALSARSRSSALPDSDRSNGSRSTATAFSRPARAPTAPPTTRRPEASVGRADLSIGVIGRSSHHVLRITLPESEIARLEGLRPVPGMPVESFIRTGQRTVLSYVTKPFADQISRRFQGRAEFFRYAGNFRRDSPLSWIRSELIFVSVGYAKNPQGYMAIRIGPLGADGGERRLNVLISRANQRCCVFASITDEDIDLERAKGKGVFPSYTTEWNTIINDDRCPMSYSGQVLLSDRPTSKGRNEMTIRRDLIINDQEIRPLVIEVLAPNNPRREKTHGHYSLNLYRTGMTVQEYLESSFDDTLPIRWGTTHTGFTGPKLTHLRYDWAKGFIQLVTPG